MRTVVILVALSLSSLSMFAADVALRSADRTYHALDCAEVRPFMYRTSPPFATTQGFTPHSCSLAPVPDNIPTVVADIHPAQARARMPAGWVDFHDWSVRKQLTNEVIYLGIAPGQAASEPAGDVQVRGHWRSTPSGGQTWVDEHTRSRPGQR